MVQAEGREWAKAQSNNTAHPENRNSVCAVDSGVCKRIREWGGVETWRARVVKDAATGQAGTRWWRALPIYALMLCYSKCSLQTSLRTRLKHRKTGSTPDLPNANQPFSEMCRCLMCTLKFENNSCKHLGCILKAMRSHWNILSKRYTWSDLKAICKTMSRYKCKCGFSFFMIYLLLNSSLWEWLFYKSASHFSNFPFL